MDASEPNASSVIDDAQVGPDPTLKLPPIVLSGVLQQHGGLEWDPSGAPYYKFPPFVTPAASAPLIPFSAFKPYGIQVMLDLDEDEVDGNGVRTVQLGVKHGKDSKKKRKTRQRLDVTFERRVMWWEDWEEGENLRKGDVWDINTPRVDRFTQGAADFQKNRTWTPVLQSVYDHFTQYAGLTGKTNAHVGKGFASAKKRAQGLEEDAMDFEDDDEAAYAEIAKASNTDDVATNAASLPHHSEEARIQEIPTEYEVELERRELRLQAFLDEPDLRMKIFFSSFYKNKGLFWSESKLRDGPLLMRFFFKFFTRNGLMRDYDRAFQKALVVVERAIVELPLTTKISKTIPDDFGNACVALWGKQMTEIIEKERRKILDGRKSEKETHTEEPSDPDPPEPSSNPNLDQNTNINTTVWADTFNTLSQSNPNPSSWTPFEIPSPWGPTNADDLSRADLNGSSSAKQPEFNPWDPMSNAEADWSLPPPPSLMSIVNGPITLPLTHEVKLVEKSTRRVVAVETPDEGDKEKNTSIFSKMGKVTLAPWDPSSISNGQGDEGTILSPELYLISASTADDPTKRTIDVYITPSSSAILRGATGMGLYAVFVKVGLCDSVLKAQEEEKAKEKGPVSASAGSAAGVGKKRKSKAAASSNLKSNSSSDRQDSEFWYIEFLYEVTPSFWTESNEGIEEGSDD